MTMYLEVYDSSTNEILARTVDRKQATDYGRMTWQNSATNKTEARRMMTEWAETLRAGLDRLRATSPSGYASYRSAGGHAVAQIIMPGRIQPSPA